MKYVVLGLVFGEKYQQQFLLLYIFSTKFRDPNAKSCVGCYSLLGESGWLRGG